jgi:peptidoglycan/LPS O-acetylase OafA/YrhL
MMPGFQGVHKRSAPSLRLNTLDCLRGLAAAAVAWFHVTNGNPEFSPPALLKASGAKGWLGVEVFFVISGFVIPYALHAARYRLRDYWRFLLKRIVRLDPPYFASMALVIALAYASAAIPGFRGQPPSYTVLQLVSHAGYVTSFLGHTWVNIVYWSLALEFQYYLVIGLLFPLVQHRRAWVRGVVLIGMAAAAVAVPNLGLVFPWCFLFISGILTFQFRQGTLACGWYMLGLVLAGVGCHITLGWSIALVGLAASLVIAFVDIRNRLLLFLGEISYSLYLVHVPIGGRVINLSLKLPVNSMGKVGVAVVAFGASVAAALLFYRFVERPVRSWAARIHYGDRVRDMPEHEAPLVCSLEPTPGATDAVPPTVRD